MDPKTEGNQQHKDRPSTTSSAPATFPSSRTRGFSQGDDRIPRSRTLPVPTATLEKSLTEDDFVDRIYEHAQKSAKHALYPGENFLNLADYLAKVSSNQFLQSEKDTPALFATLCLLHDPGCKDFPSEDLQTAQDLQPVDASFCDQAKDAVNEILFMRGFPTPEWLSTIGSYFRVDPEFYRRHLDFSLFGYHNWFSTPSLPSTSDNVVRLRVTTLAKRTLEVPDVEKAREFGSDDMIQYSKRLLGFDASVGESIVRRFSVHDKKYFSLEQDISVCYCKRGRGWTVIAWLDSGKDLARGGPSPWTMTESDRENQSNPPVRGPFSLISVIRNQPRTTIHSRQSTQKSEKLLERAARFQQSRALLNLDYGRHFEGLEVYEDPFYSIEPMFKYKALAEAQFLNLVESVVTQDLESIRLTKPLGAESGSSVHYLATLRTSHANFVYHKELLESHARSIKENVWSIKSRGGPEWPKSDNPKVIAAAEVLEKDYIWLEGRAQELSALCDRGMKEIHDKATLAESIRSNELADRVNKLTKLATLMSVFYIPLSFTTGFFGMNFSVFGQGNVKVWWWAVISVPVLAVSVLVMFFGSMVKFFKDLRRRRIEDEAGPSRPPWWA